MGRLTLLAMLAGIYLEESGVPMPLPSEVTITYLAHRMIANPLALLGTWIGLTAVVVCS
ncbi:MAG TPA: hypothetical protein VET65_11200 [Candidatus Limnocylindrales bacterium]|nr:hypothetical protein [Candidatus Limnocylindrales bacterium]